MKQFKLVQGEGSASGLGDGCLLSRQEQVWAYGRDTFVVTAVSYDEETLMKMMQQIGARLMYSPAQELPLTPYAGDGRIWDGSKWIEICPTLTTYVCLELVARLNAMTKEAADVMDTLRKYGPSIVPHLLDSDDNAGERLRKLIAKGIVS